MEIVELTCHLRKLLQRLADRMDRNASGGRREIHAHVCPAGGDLLLDDPHAIDLLFSA